MTLTTHRRQPTPHPVSSPAPSTVTSGSLRTARRLLTLLPLLWAAGAGGPALAVELIYQGAPGSSGLTGATPGASGTAGTSGSAAVRGVSSGDASNLVDITGGSGGQGGHGADGNPGQQSGNGGAGGAAGASDASLTFNAPAGGATARLNSTGGAGGNGGLPGFGDLIGQSAAGGNGGNASANSLSVINSGTLTLTQAATGGGGGSTLFGFGGSGGSASSVLNAAIGNATSVTLDSTATGGVGGVAAGDPNSGGQAGSAGAGGAATSTVRLITLPGANPATGWNSVVAASSTALAGAAGDGAFTPDGATADANIVLNSYGSASGTALARGNYGASGGGTANANAEVNAAYSAIASADALGGGARFTSGAGAAALARASSAYHANATARAESGSGRAGGRDASIATAEATVNRGSSTLLPPTPSQPAEARAFATGGAFGGQALARSTYRDSVLGAAVSTTASGPPAQLYTPEASSAANVGGPAYGPWSPDGGITRVTAYASALPDVTSLAPLLTQSPTVDAALVGADVLGAGTVGALFFPYTSSASFELPFTSGRHLLLGLVQPFSSDFYNASFEFSVQQGATTLYAGSFSDPAQTAAFFNDRVLDLGLINSYSLDLLLTFSFNTGLYGFSYILAAGDAVTAVPETSTWLMLVLGLVLLGWRSSRQTAGFAPIAKLKWRMCNVAQQLH